jgi:hypothetical protein
MVKFLNLKVSSGSWNITISVVKNATGLTTGESDLFLGRGRDFSLLCSVQTHSLSLLFDGY